MYGETPYDKPERYGLEIVYEDEQEGGYKFDKFVVWRSINGSLFYATDSGCSCPSPFEDLDDTTDNLEPVGPRQVVDRYREWLGDSRTGDAQPLQAALRAREGA